jgi:hypothetical protein
VAGSEFADDRKFQTSKFSYMHAMRQKDESVETATAKMNAYVSEHMKNYIDLKNADELEKHISSSAWRFIPSWIRPRHRMPVFKSGKEFWNSGYELGGALVYGTKDLRSAAKSNCRSY